MADKKPLFMSTDGYSEEMAVTDEVQLGKLTINAGGTGIVMSGLPITGLPDTPPSGDAAANKNYVDAVAQSLKIKDPVKGMSTADITTLSGLTTTVDTTVALDTDGDRVLLTGQSPASENGIWIVHSGAWTRPTDFAVGSHASGAFTFIEQGTLYADTGWVCTTDGPTDVVGTDSLAFVQFSSAGVITAGAGLDKSGQSIFVKSGDGIEVTSNTASTNVALSASNPGLALVGTAGTKTLEAAVVSTGGIEKAATGLQLKLNGTTLQTSGSGVSVKGVPNLFEVGGVATSQTPGTGQVTAANLNTLTAGAASNADALHVHTVTAAPTAQRVENALAVSEAIAQGDPVYQSTTNDQVGKADTVDPKAYVIGIARTGQSTPGNTAPIVADGPCPGILSGATAGNKYYLATGGGLSTSAPGSNKRVILCGIAKNGTDLHVRIIDYGKKAA